MAAKQVVKEEPLSQTEPTEDEIRKRAYEIYLARNAGGFDDWLKAEAELKEARRLFQHEHTVEPQAQSDGPLAHAESDPSRGVGKQRDPEEGLHVDVKAGPRDPSR